VIERGIHKALFHLEPGGRVVLGRGAWVQTFDSSVVFSCKQGAEITTGERCWFSGGIIGASERISIGDHTLIGWGCTILDSSLHRLDNDAPEAAPEPVEIGSHVWMPSNITVLPGVKIGDHCVIGTGSLVTGDIPPNSFAAGRPAEVVREIGDRDRVE
jgi:maltose O-acetyltransferase